MSKRTVSVSVNVSFNTVAVADADAAMACPTCGSELKGTIDVLSGTIGVDIDDSGVFYNASGTEIDWDSSETAAATVDGHELPLLLCYSGHYFVHQGIKEIQ